MKSAALGCIAALALTVAANAQSTDAPATAAPAASTAAASGDFIAKQQMGTVRAPKLVGVAVYDNNNKSVGKIDDLLLDHDGSVKAVVIGVGGFLGIGKKDVAVPYSALKWQTEQRTVAVNEPAAVGATPGQAPAAADKQATKTVDPAATEAYQGYPDRAIIAMSQDQLKAAPDFKYADNPNARMSDAATDTTTPAAKP